MFTTKLHQYGDKIREDIARKMLDDGLSPAKIAQYTGLSLREVIALCVLTKRKVLMPVSQEHLYHNNIDHFGIDRL